MRYKKFIIKGYRGISDTVELNISKNSIIPIIGKNESGKTTCLEAINAFDHTNDEGNNGKHLVDIENLYSTTETPVVVGAEIDEISKQDLFSVFGNHLLTAEENFTASYPDQNFDPNTVNVENLTFANVNHIKAYQEILFIAINKKEAILIERNLRTKKYNIPLFENILDSEEINLIGESFVSSLPYILYFDDFRDRLPEKVCITSDSGNSLFSIWILYIDELFKKTKNEYSVFALPNKQDSIRRSILKEVQKHLNEVLISEWSNYQFDNKENIEIIIEYNKEPNESFLQFKIVEHVTIGNETQERFFDISNRSKGFYWYFNFMLKLHFNPNKREVNDIDTVYLLDEPGSYLHTYALDKLAEQLHRLSKSNKVIYCTHFHNLLNPEFIPINSIRVAEKINKGKIQIKTLDEVTLTKGLKNSAYQPVLDALEVKPPLLQYQKDNIVLVEGIYDYYSFKMFCSPRIDFFPCAGASSIVNQIPFMIFMDKKYLSMWDNDQEGRSRLSKAKMHFGEREAEKFFTLSTINNQEDATLEDYFINQEVENYKEKILGDTKTSLYKLIIDLFYRANREEIITQYFSQTRKNFLSMESNMKSLFENIYNFTFS